jgi:pimeloyl-ACP methyl ester carboxylesterase
MKTINCCIISMLVSIWLFQEFEASAQNIVTYLGKEKIEKTEEGDVFFRFTDGLLLPGGGNTSSYFSAQDMIAWLYATDRFVTPAAGDSLAFSYPAIAPVNPQQPPAERNSRFQFGPQLPRWKWVEAKADTAGVFQGPAMRSAYLYTSYVSPETQLALLETTGSQRTFVNGIPHEGDYYDYGYTLTPVKLQKGRNEFVHTPGRFGRIASKLVKPVKPVMFTKRDMTLPDLLIGETAPQWAAIRIINLTEKPLKGLKIRSTLPTGEQMEYQTDDLIAMSVRKVKFQFPALPANDREAGEITVGVELLDRSGKVLDRINIPVRKAPVSEHHTRTFVSRIEGSVQFFTTAPALRKTPGETKGLTLSTHGAGVDAHVQAGCYSRKEDVDLVAATNRRPYGFDWEDWGRIDALEVLDEAGRIFKPDPSRIYLTGHSMGGHGAWYLGITYPDRFAAIAPCAGYPDLGAYGSRGRTDNLEQFPKYDAFKRAANHGRTLSMLNNLTQSGVYIFHGSEDRVVHTNQARQMRELLGKFHADFCYYEYPGGEHWFGCESMDWFPIFEFFARHTIPQVKDVKEIDFTTATPGVSASDYWLRVEQQIEPFRFTNVKASRDNDTVRIEKAENAALLALDLPALSFTSGEVHLHVDGQQFLAPAGKKAILSYGNGEWGMTDAVDPKRKYSARSGGFKSAFDHRVVLVYATKGTAKENEWYLHKARFDAETFYYRGNGSFDVIPDTEYSIGKYAGRNVILYGNRNTNSAWNLLLKDCPVQVSNGTVTAGGKTYKGNDLGIYFVYPHPQSDVHSVGVVAGTGEAGIKATMLNNYLLPITGFPDLMIFRADMLRTGLDGVEAAGFFDNSWTLPEEP